MEALDIAPHSRLLRSRYTHCIPLLHSHSPPSGEDAAFLSSVASPSQLYLSLPCLAWRRTRDSGALLILVPFETPRNEVFAEIPLHAFCAGREARNGKHGVRLVPLNAHSLLCSSARDGLPPRNGLFITFRTEAALRRFRDTLEVHEEEICGAAIPSRSPSSPQRWSGEMGVTSPTRRPDRMAGSNTGAIQSRRETSRYIDNLLAERDRRRESYRMQSVDTTGDDVFASWASQHQQLHPNVWNLLAGAAARRPMESTNTPPLAQRETLLRELRAAMEAYDDMNETNQSLMGTARDFLRKHQEDLWGLERYEPTASCAPPSHSHLAPNPAPPSSITPNPYVSSSVPLQASPLPPLELLESQESTRQAIPQPPLTPIPTLRPQSVQELQPQKQLKSEEVEEQHLSPSPSLPPHIVPESGSNGAVISARIATPDLTPQGAMEPLRTSTGNMSPSVDLEHAMAVEARLVAAAQKVPPKPMASKRVFGSAPKLPTPVPLPRTTPVDTEVGHAVEEKRESKVVETAPPHCGNGWKAVCDAASGKYYFVHTATKKTTWRPEDTFHDESDAEKGKTMSENATKTTREKTAKESSSPKCGPGWRTVSDSNTGRTYYVNKTTKATTWKLEDTLDKTLEKTVQKVVTDWAERVDPSTGKTYFYNKKTKQTTWKRAETDLGSP